MRILVAYYTQTGNTKTIAQAIHDELAALGHGVTIENVRGLKGAGVRSCFLTSDGLSHPLRDCLPSGHRAFLELRYTRAAGSDLVS